METTNRIIQEIKEKINNAPKGDFVQELHLQCIKYARQLKNVSGIEFCTLVGISKNYCNQFYAMRKISDKLEKAGLNTNMLK